MNENDGQKFEYDIQKRAKAGTAATFRAIVAAYIAYLGYRLIRGASDPEASMAPWVAWTVGLVFIAAAVGFGVYIWKQWHIDVEAARLPETTEKQENEEPSDE